MRLSNIPFPYHFSLCFSIIITILKNLSLLIHMKRRKFSKNPNHWPYPRKRGMPERIQIHLCCKPSWRGCASRWGRQKSSTSLTTSGWWLAVPRSRPGGGRGVRKPQQHLNHSLHSSSTPFHNEQEQIHWTRSKRNKDYLWFHLYSSCNTLNNPKLLWIEEF